MLLEQSRFFIKERVGVLKLTDVYDIFDPTSQQQIGVAKEEPPFWVTLLRMVTEKHHLPTTVNVYEDENAAPVFSVHRPFVFFRSKIRVVGADGQAYGYFKSKLFSLGGGFYVYDNADQQVAEVKGDWKGWNFKFIASDGREIGSVSKQWAGMLKEMFTSADNYLITLNDGAAGDSVSGMLLLAAGLAIDVVYKESE